MVLLVMDKYTAAIVQTTQIWENCQGNHNMVNRAIFAKRVILDF